MLHVTSVCVSVCVVIVVITAIIARATWIHPYERSTIRLRFDDENRVISHPLLANRAIIRI